VGKGGEWEKKVAWGNPTATGLREKKGDSKRLSKTTVEQHFKRGKPLRRGGISAKQAPRDRVCKGYPDLLKGNVYVVAANGFKRQSVAKKREKPNLEGSSKYIVKTRLVRPGGII